MRDSVKSFVRMVSDVEESDVVLKGGAPAGNYRLENMVINTGLLHNTHSFVVVINDQKMHSVI